MSDIPTNKPLGILKTSNRNDNFKIPSVSVSKPEKEQNKHHATSNTTPHPKTPRPPKAVNNENVNPNRHFAENSKEMSNSIKETPGKSISELCKQMSALALLTPDGMPLGRKDTQAQPKKVKLPFSEPFTGVDKLVEKDSLSDTEEIEPISDTVPRKTLVITDDDEFFTDAAEYFRNEDLNNENTSDNDAFKSLESSPRTSLNVSGTLGKNSDSEIDLESAVIGTDNTQETFLQEKVSDENIHKTLESLEPEINSDLFSKRINDENIGNLSQSRGNRSPSSEVICTESETVVESQAEDFTNLPKDANLIDSTDLESGDDLKINDDQNCDGKRQNTVLGDCNVKEKIAQISIPEKFDNFNDQDKSKDTISDSEISNQINEAVATGPAETDKRISDSETTLTVQTEERVAGDSPLKETVDSETEIAKCLASEEKPSDIVEYFEGSSKVDLAKVDAGKTEENNSNLLESQNVDCIHGSPKPQPTEKNTCENEEINKPVSDIGRPVDEKPVLHSPVNVIQSVEMANDSSGPLTMETDVFQRPVDKNQNADILDTCKVTEETAHISLSEKFDNFNDKDKSKDGTCDSGSVGPSEISNQINEPVANGSAKTDNRMSDNETTLTVQAEEKIAEGKKMDSFETEIAKCLTSKERIPEEKSSDSNTGAANVNAEKTEENLNVLESQKVDCSHGSPKPQLTEENAHLSKADASVAENVEINKPVSDIGRPVDVIQSVKTANISTDPSTMESYIPQSPVNKRQSTDVLGDCNVEEKIAQISISEKFDNFKDQDKSKGGSPDSGSVGPSEISKQVSESVATGSTKSDKCMSDSETTLMVRTEEIVAGDSLLKETIDSETADCLTSKEKIPEEKSSDIVEYFESNSKIDTANVDAEKTEENNSNLLLESQRVDCGHGSPKPQSSEENAHLSKAIADASVAENVEINKPVSDIARPVDTIDEIMEFSEVKDAINRSKNNCEIPNSSITASNDNLEKFETISNPLVKDVDTISTDTPLLNSPISIEKSRGNIMSFESKTQKPTSAVVVENPILTDIAPTSPNEQQQVSNGTHVDPHCRQNINAESNRKDAEPAESADTANYVEQEPNVLVKEGQTNGFICDDDDWELLNCDKTVMNASRLCRESLYVKFDPLLGLNSTIDFDMHKNKNVSKPPALEKIKSPPTSPDLIMMDSPTRKSMYQKVSAMRKPNGNTNKNLDDIFSLSPANNNADAVFFGTPLPQKKSSEIVQVLKYTEDDWLKMKQNIELEYQNRLMSASKELTQKMSEITEEHQKTLSEKDTEIEQVKKDLLQLQSEKKSDKEKLADMKKVLDEYTIFMDHLAAENKKYADDYKKGIDGNKKEVDLIQDELQTVEKAYSDLHRRFEKAKTMIESLKKNEEILKNHIKDIVAKVKEGKMALVTLKKESQETHANFEKEITALKKKLANDTSFFEASSKRKDMKIAEQLNELQLKKNQIEELTKICDDLMAKVGDSH